MLVEISVHDVAILRMALDCMRGDIASMDMWVHADDRKRVDELRKLRTRQHERFHNYTMFTALEEELIRLFDRGVDIPLSDDAFNDLALRIFRFQCEALPRYGGFARAREKGPEDVSSWEEIPAVPTRAFKALTLICGDADHVERVFRTSGTSGGETRRGEHHVRSLALYRASLLPNFGAHLLPESTTHQPMPPEVMPPEVADLAGEVPVRLFSLIPSQRLAR